MITTVILGLAVPPPLLYCWGVIKQSTERSSMTDPWRACKWKLWHLKRESRSKGTKSGGKKGNSETKSESGHHGCSPWHLFAFHIISWSMVKHCEHLTCMHFADGTTSLTSIITVTHRSPCNKVEERPSSWSWLWTGALVLGTGFHQGKICALVQIYLFGTPSVSPTGETLMPL